MSAISMTIRQALRMASHAFTGSDTGQIDAELLLSHVLGKPRAWLYTWPEHTLSPAQRSAFEETVERRMLGEPVAYIIGTRDFWTLTLHVNRHVLIPRPETELLVETALTLAESSASGPAPQAPCSSGPALKPTLRVADLGTGSGAIALALASERPDWEIVATDRSIEALMVASDNATRLGLRNVQFCQGNWCEALPAGMFDLIISNPPYIDPADSHLQQGDLRFEPMTALSAADSGLADIRLLCSQSVRHLKPGGWLLIEHGWQQGPAVTDILRAAGLASVHIRQDLAGRDRLTLGNWSPVGNQSAIAEKTEQNPPP